MADVEIADEPSGTFRRWTGRGSSDWFPRMRNFLAVPFVVFAAGVVAVSAPRAAEPKPLLVPGVTIKIPDAKGSFDFIQVDLANRRLLACHTKDGTLDVIDLDK